MGVNSRHDETDELALPVEAELIGTEVLDLVLDVLLNSKHLGDSERVDGFSDLGDTGV